MHHHQRTISLCSLSRIEGMPDQKQFIRGKWPFERMPKPYVVPFGVARGGDCLQNAKQVGFEVEILPGDTPFVKGPKPGKGVPLFRCVTEAEGKEAPGKTFVEIGPVEQAQSGLASQPSFKVTERGEVIVDGAGLLSADSVRQIKLHQILSPWCKNALPIGSAPSRPVDN
jgi:hypothetical protein